MLAVAFIQLWDTFTPRQPDLQDLLGFLLQEPRRCAAKGHVASSPPSACTQVKERVCSSLARPAVPMNSSSSSAKPPFNPSQGSWTGQAGQTHCAAAHFGAAFSACSRCRAAITLKIRANKNAVRSSQARARLVLIVSGFGLKFPAKDTPGCLLQTAHGVGSKQTGAKVLPVPVCEGEQEESFLLTAR